MEAANPQAHPEIFRPKDSRWASRAFARGEIRRLARGLYTHNLDEPPQQLLRRRWHEVAALWFPGAVIVDRSAVLAGPAEDGSLFLDTGKRPTNPRPVVLPGLMLRPRNGVGSLAGDMPFGRLWIAGQPRSALENLRPSRARSGVARTLGRSELEAWLERIAATRGPQALNELRDAARELAPALDAQAQLAQLDALIGAMLGTRDAPLQTPAARARATGLPYDTDRLASFEKLRQELATRRFVVRAQPDDPERLFAFFEAYFSNWIEGTIFDLPEAEEIVFKGRVPLQRPADAHDVQGTFAAITDRRLREMPPTSADELEAFLREAHHRVMAGRPELAPGTFKDRPNRAGPTIFVAPELVRGTLREGFAAMQTLPAGIERAAFAMFLVAEVHPFTDGNGRVARLLMNAELSAQAQCRVMIPPCYRDEYLSALRAISHNGDPRPLWRMLDRAQRWALKMPWSGHDRVLEAMHATNALRTPEEVQEQGLRLLDPPDNQSSPQTKPSSLQRRAVH
ncbi:MAG: Fic family protein [Solirubrobacteraceae bacterium]